MQHNYVNIRYYNVKVLHFFIGERHWILLYWICPAIGHSLVRIMNTVKFFYIPVDYLSYIQPPPFFFSSRYMYPNWYLSDLHSLINLICFLSDALIITSALANKLNVNSILQKSLKKNFFFGGIIGELYRNVLIIHAAWTINTYTAV